MCGYPRAITLNSGGERYDMLYIHDQDAYAAHVADGGGSRALRSQGMFRRKDVDTMAFSSHRKIKGYIYLRYYNVVNGLLYAGLDNRIEMTEYSDMFIEKSKIYNNGGSEVWR